MGNFEHCVEEKSILTQQKLNENNSTGTLIISHFCERRRENHVGTIIVDPYIQETK